MSKATLDFYYPPPAENRQNFFGVFLQFQIGVDTGLAESVPSGAAHYMTNDEALDWICDEFGFDRSKVTILHEVDEYEINRHSQLRRTGKKIDRRPVYCATDYHYIRFNVGRGQWQWEAWNGQLQPFYD